MAKLAHRINDLSLRIPLFKHTLKPQKIKLLLSTHFWYQEIIKNTNGKS